MSKWQIGKCAVATVWRGECRHFEPTATTLDGKANKDRKMPTRGTEPRRFGENENKWIIYQSLTNHWIAAILHYTPTTVHLDDCIERQ